MEVTYKYVKGAGWVPAMSGGRTADQTLGLPFKDLRTGDAVYVIHNGKRRVAKVHQRGEAAPLEADDSGCWYKDDSAIAPFVVHPFGRIGAYGRSDSAWTRLVGISFPGGKDYEI